MYLRWPVLFLLPLLLCGLYGVAQAQIHFEFENPAEGQVVSGLMPISGWAFVEDGSEVTVQYRLLREEVVEEVEVVPWTEIPCCISREDVQATHGEAGLQSGFGAILNFNLLEEGEQTIEIQVEGGSANSESPASHKITVVKPGGFEFLENPSLNLSRQPEIEDQEIVIERVTVQDKALNDDDPPTHDRKRVTLHLAWRQSLQHMAWASSAP